MNIQKIIGIAAFLLIALNMFVQTEAKPLKQSFQSGPRYGRGGRVGAKKIFAPRNERFEMGTRYGKRSGLGEIAETLIYPVAAPPLSRTVLCGKDNELICTHTGVANIYRCNQSYDEDAKNELQPELKD
ncbi:RYamide neuropeptides-like isoform X2 [Atheta coriaria]|uniref:RYamide neuropeptides-like isoform X2 n=1 Tax=Dalotia coriaria TaxID=877792 RepID=UPI0031F3DF2D